MKSKSMLQEECGMTPALESHAVKARESDPGERIQQLRIDARSKPDQRHLRQRQSDLTPTTGSPLYLQLGAHSTHFGYRADWSDKRHHFRRLASEFVGTFGFVFSLSGGAAIFHAYAKPPLSTGATVVVLTMVAAMWLVIAIYALGDVSAHFNPAVTFAFALRGDMSWPRTALYWVFQCAGAGAASLLARLFFGSSSALASVHPQPGQAWPAVGFETLLTACFVTLVLAMARGPKLNGPFTPLAVGAYVLSFGAVGGLYEGAAFNPARAFGPDLATGHFNDLWIYVLGSTLGAVLAVGVDRYFRGAADLAEAGAAESEHLTPKVSQ